MSHIAKLVIVTLGLFLGFVAGGVYFLKSADAINHKVQVKINNQYIVADIAKTDSTREKGLSGRTAIGINEGMFFHFDAPGMYGFWMKGMRVPIDILWIANHRVIGVEENIDPQIGAREKDLKMYLPTEPIDRVLELAAGRAKLLRAHEGDMVYTRSFFSRAF